MIESIHYEHQPKIRKDSYYEKAKKKSDEEDQKLCKKLNIRFR